MLQIAIGGVVLAADVAVPDADHAYATRRHQGIPSIAASPVNGRLWCTWYGGPTAGEDANNYAVLATSCDGGDTWKEVLVADPDGKENDMTQWQAYQENGKSHNHRIRISVIHLSQYRLIP